MHVKILSFNTWQQRGPWEERWELIYKNLAELNPDIIGLQEVFDMNHAREIQKRSGYECLTLSGEPSSGLIYLSRFPVVETECLEMKTKSPTEDYSRFGHYALFDLGELKLVGLNTHLSWKMPEEESRLGQVEELMTFANRKQGTYGFMTGDYNAAPNTTPILSVLEEWRDSYAEAHPGTQDLTWDYKNPFAARARDEMPERRIDYVFVRGEGLEVFGSKIVMNTANENGVYPSDHFGVLTTIDIGDS